MTRFIPRFLALLVVFSGIVDIFSALFLRSPIRLALLLQFFPLNVLFASRTITLLAGLFLVFLGRGLWQRKRRSYRLSLFLLTTSFVGHLVKGLDIEESLIIGVPILLLLIYRQLFTVQSGRITFKTTMKTTAVTLIILFIYAFFGFFLFQGHFTRHVTVKAIARDYAYTITGVGNDVLIPRDRRARWFENSISFVGIAAIGVMLAGLFAPFVRQTEPTDADRQRVRALLSRYGSNSTSYFALLSDKQYFFTPDKACVIAYVIKNGVAVALGEPIGSIADKPICLRQFTTTMEEHGLVVAYTNILEAEKKLFAGEDFSLIQIGEEATIPTKHFTLEGPHMKDVRNAVAKGEREHVAFSWYQADSMPWQVLRRIDTLHTTWLKTKKMQQLSYSLDYYPFPTDPSVYVLTAARQEKSLDAVFSFLPYQDGYVLDLMLRSPDGPNGVMETGIVKAIQFFREKGYQSVSLSTAPLSDTNDSEEKTIVQKATSTISERFNQFYNFQSLFTFKDKFHPQWTPKYLAYRPRTQLPRVAIALLRVHMPRRLG